MKKLEEIEKAHETSVTEIQRHARSMFSKRIKQKIKREKIKKLEQEIRKNMKKEVSALKKGY